MCTLNELMKHSTVLGPLVRLAHVSHNTVSDWTSTSSVVQFLSQPISMFQNQLASHAQIIRLLRTLMGVVLLGLLLALNILDTGMIGAITWVLLLVSFLFLLGRGCSVLKELTIIDLLVMLFVGSAIVSTGFSSYLKYSVIGLAKMLTFVAGYTAFRIWISSQGDKRQPLLLLAGLLTMMGLFQSLVGFDQFFNHVDARATWVDPTINAELNLTRIFGTLKPNNPNLLAGFLIPCLASSVGLLMWRIGQQCQPGQRRQQWNILLLLALAGTTVAILAALVLTGSRGGFLALAGMAFILFAMLGHLLWNPPGHPIHSKTPGGFSRKSLKLAWVGILLVSILSASALVMKSPQLRHRVASIFSMRQDSSISYRLNVYHSVMDMIKDNPVVGIGPGNDTFKRVYGYYMVPGFNALGAYSVPLEIAAEQGLIGLGIFLLLIACIKLRALYFLDSAKPLFEKMAVITLLCAILGSILYGVFDTIWYRPSVNLLFWLAVALLAHLTRDLHYDAR